MFEKQFGNTKLRTLEYKLELYKQKLKGSCAKLKYQKIYYINGKSSTVNLPTTHKFYCQMKVVAVKVEVLPLKNDIAQFWSDIWGNKGNFNYNAEWLKLVETSYCLNVIEKDYSIQEGHSKATAEKVTWTRSYYEFMVQKAFLFHSFHGKFI